MRESVRRDVRAHLQGEFISLVHEPTGEIIEEFLLKPAEARHRSFIISTWVKSYQGQARKQNFEEFYNKHEPAVAEARWQDCLVATDEDGYTVYAWVCGSEGRLFHCYTIPELRMLRVATRLIEKACGPGGVKEYARPFPYAAHARLNPYLIGSGLK